MNLPYVVTNPFMRLINNIFTSKSSEETCSSDENVTG